MHSVWSNRIWLIRTITNEIKVLYYSKCSLFFTDPNGKRRLTTQNQLIVLPGEKHHTWHRYVTIIGNLDFTQGTFNLDITTSVFVKTFNATNTDDILCRQCAANEAGGFLLPAQEHTYITTEWARKTRLLGNHRTVSYFFIKSKGFQQLLIGSVHKMYVYLDTAMRCNVIHILHTLFTENGRNITPFSLNA